MGRNVELIFYKYIRPEQKFTSFEALKAQIRRDIESGKNWFQEEKRAGKKLYHSVKNSCLQCCMFYAILVEV